MMRSDTKAMHITMQKIAAQFVIFTLSLVLVYPAYSQEKFPSSRKGISVPAFVATQVLKYGVDRLPIAFKKDANYCNAQHASGIRSVGIGLIRLVVNPLPLIEEDGRLVASGSNEVANCARIYSRAGISVIVDLHFWSPEPEESLKHVFTDGKLKGRYQDAVRILASKIQQPVGALPIALELLNEPPLCDGRSPIDWTSEQLVLYNAARSAAPLVPLVLTGCGGQLNGLVALDPLPYQGDANVLFTFHFYEPFLFTHQVTYYGSYLHGIRFPQISLGSASASREVSAITARSEILNAKADAIKREVTNYVMAGYGDAEIRLRFNKVKVWAEMFDIHPSKIFLGEFGVVSTVGRPTDQLLQDDSVNWIKTVRTIADELGFSYAWWILPRKEAWSYSPTPPGIQSRVLEALDLKDGQLVPR